MALMRSSRASGIQGQRQKMVNHPNRSKKLNLNMRSTLEAVAACQDGPGFCIATADNMGADIQTLRALANRGMISHSKAISDCSSLHDAIVWSITQAGRDALAGS